jgi:recombination protein RecA
VMATETHRLGDQQWQVVLGSVLGNGDLSPNGRDRSGARLRLRDGVEQRDYLEWKVSLLGNVGCSRMVDGRGAAVAEFTPLPELDELQRTVHLAGGQRTITEDYLKALTPLALAIWFMDDGSLTTRSEEPQEGTGGGSGRVQLCVDALSEGSRDRLVDYLRDTHGLDVSWSSAGAAGRAELRFSTEASHRFLTLVAPYVHPSMDHKLPEGLRGRFDVAPELVDAVERPVPARILDIRVQPPTQDMHKFDIEVEGSHNYFADGVMVHNSPETTTGGRALKFYASVRLDVRRIETLKDGQEMVGNRTRIKVVKNKVAPPFKQAEFDIMYGQGISREGGLIDVGVEAGLVRKAGAWYTYEGDQLGQGKENARAFLRDNPDLANEIEKKILEKLGVGPQVDGAEAPDAGGTVETVSLPEPTGIDF